MIITLNKREQKVGLFYLLLSVLVLPSIITLGLPMVIPGLSAGILNLIYFIVNFLAVAVLFRSFWRTTLKHLGERPGTMIRSVLFGFLGYQLLSVQAARLILMLDPGFFNVNDQQIIGILREDFYPMAFGTVILVPVAEEALYRGVLFGPLLKKNAALAYILSTLAFGLIHVVGYVGQYSLTQLGLCLIQYIPAGICLGWAYHRSGTIAAPILIHATVNAIAIFASR